MNFNLVALGIGGLLALGASSANAALDDAKAAALIKAAGCGLCHSVDKKLVGPAYKDVAAKHKGEVDAPAKLAKSVREGSKGVYGPIPMPPSPAARISDADLHNLIEWVLTK